MHLTPWLQALEAVVASVVAGEVLRNEEGSLEAGVPPGGEGDVMEDVEGEGECWLHACLLAHVMRGGVLLAVLLGVAASTASATQGITRYSACMWQS